MVGVRRVLATLSLSTTLVSRPLVAQMANATAIHTVSVTIAPRVRVQVSPIVVSTLSSASITTNKSASGVAVRVAATQPWVLSIAAARRSTPVVKWSRSRQKGYTALSAKPTRVASGEHGPTSADETLFLRAAGANDADDAPVVLTIAAR